MDERYAAIRAAVEDWKARFPLVTQAWLHLSEDGTRIWLTDGQDGPVLAEARLPVEERAQPRGAAGTGAAIGTAATPALEEGRC